ncbi:hydroxyacylglutathione hydrolase [Caldimicrobium thiodismutans]|jgi:glyoxylase-like metal-dependent hydrolase (beta-lactamase superfamily II)|uniref:Hydroxyacylglutathione hydrolase n=1 Tax=Caldimicrobium thiodismutans TaxID=1653476 RepID=A0A0U4W3W8_9BACT|nr:MBL fold metallo-hydrolase [Caldimicrobium thiodismutans]BAU23787.1 hydroxyacylglutathione hydrolase [Caldimicrobium thiodismutans]
MKIETFIVGPLQVCCYLLYDENTREGVVIDPGDSDPRIIKSLSELNLKIKYILGTHGHPDHILGASFLRETLKAPFLLHKEDDKFFQDPENFFTFKVWGFPENPRADGIFEDGEILSFGDCNLKVIHTPGHSPGSVCFYEEKRGVLFSGDTLFVEAIGRADLPGGSYKLMMKSIKEKLLILPDETEVYPGHDYGPRPVSTIGHEKRFNPFINEG